MSRKDGGPAHPVPAGPFSGPHPGATLRDAFAMAALTGLMAAQIHGFNDSPAKGPFVAMAYELADAMLAERDRT